MLRISRKLKENCNAVRASRNLNVQQSAVVFEHIKMYRTASIVFPNVTQRLLKPVVVVVDND
jgi:hypothetical protein